MNGLNKHRVCTLAVAALAVLTACSNESSVEVANNQLSARLVMPAPLFSARAPSNPVPAILLNGNSVDVVREGDSDQWTAGIDLPRNRQFQLVVQWAENGSLIYAEATDCFSTAGEAPIALSFSSADYDTSQDADGDGHSNLVELNDGTNTSDENDPPERLAKSVLSLSVAWPEALRLPGTAFESYRLRVLVNGSSVNDTLSVNESNNGYLAQASVSVGSRAFVIVEWNYVLPDSTVMRVARLAKAQQINDGGDTFFQANEADYRTDYDQDSDGISNLQEVRDGSAPGTAGTKVCIR